MRKTKLFALALAGMMTLGSATPVLADTTNVGFTKTAPNKAFTMTVPTGNTSVATDGTFSSIGELKVVSDDAFDTGSKVEVTVARNTVMTNTDTTKTTNNTITYELYTGTEKNDDNKVANGDKIDFSASDIDAKTPVKMGVAISGTNYAQLAYGDYRDTITFVAEAKEAATTLSKAEVMALIDEIGTSKLYRTDNDYWTLSRYMSYGGLSFAGNDEQLNYDFEVDEEGNYIFTSVYSDEMHENITKYKVVITDGKVTSVINTRVDYSMMGGEKREMSNDTYTFVPKNN